MSVIASSQDRIHRVAVFGAAGLAVILWASVYSALRVALKDFSAGELAFLRLAIASIALGIHAALIRERIPGLSHWPRLGLLGLIGFAAYWMLLNLGQRTVEAGTASFIINTTPALAAALAVVFLKERFKPFGAAGIAVSLCGVALIIVGGGTGLRFEFSLGALILLCAAFVHAVHFVLQKATLRTLSPVQVTLGSMWAGTVLLLPFAPDAGMALLAAPASTVATVIYLGIFTSALAHLAWAFVLKHMTASKATSFLMLIPPGAVVIGALWLGEMLPLLAWLGGALTITGVALVQAKAHG